MAVYQRWFEVKAPLNEVAAFHDDPRSLTAITPPPIRVKIDRFDAPARTGSRVIFRLMLGPIGMMWDGEIADYQPQKYFRDVMHRGPFGAWSHTHSFIAGAGSTIVHDRVEYQPPFGFVGKLLDPLLVKPSLRYLFFYRARKTKQRLEKRVAPVVARGW